MVKVSDDSIRKLENTSRSFQKMPQLYLELIENKDKIRPDRVNKEYIPDDSSEISEILSVRGGDVPQESKSKSSSRQPKYQDTVSEEEEDEGSDDSGDEEEEEEDDDDETENEEDDDEEDSDADEEEEEESDSDEEDSDDSETAQRIHNKPKTANANITSKLYDLLSEEKPVGMTESFSPGGGVSQAPRLSELENTGQIHRERHIPDYTNQVRLTDEEQDELKREILFKFELLKKSYKNIQVDIPEFTMHSDYNNMKRAYDNTVRRVSLDASVESYKTYLIGGFMVIEFILGMWFKFDMNGFTQQQILNMGSYERLLIELGEKNYVPEGSDWPVELRLLFMILMNAAIFIVSKMILKKTGTNFMSMLNNMNNFHQEHSSRRKMRGPNIDVENIPDNFTV